MNLLHVGQPERVLSRLPDSAVERRFIEIQLPDVTMACVGYSSDDRRDQLREENGFHDLVLQTSDQLTLKPVVPRTELKYRATLHEWDL